MVSRVKHALTRIHYCRDSQMASTFNERNRPRIWAIGISHLRELYRELASSYDTDADLRIVESGFEEALQAIAAAGAERPDAIVSAGANGSYIKARTDVPVVLVVPTGFDVMHALARARREAQSIALVTHGETPPEVLRFLAAFGVDVKTTSYLATQDAETCVLDLRDSGVDTVVGPGLVTELAARAGMRSVFLYSLASVQAAFDHALELARATRAEAIRRRRLDRVLENLRDGVIALDAAGRIEAISGRMAEILSVPPSRAIGRLLIDVSLEVASAIPNETGESLQTIHSVGYVVHRRAWEDLGAAPGAIVTFQESLALQRMDRSVRSRQRTSQFVARYEIGDLLGQSQAINSVRERVMQYAGSGATTLIAGETGTGKEIVAQSVHNLSSRRTYPFVALNCGAFPEALLESELFGYEEGAFTGAKRGGKVGLIEAAHRGTLFLDEIAEMPFALQSRLLRVIQEREVVRLGSTEPVKVDVRVIAATHHELKHRVDAGEFRADLYYRLNVLTIVMPSLRERATDIPLLATHLLAMNKPDWLFEDAEAALQPVLPTLMTYVWPGNVRELQNIMERISMNLSSPGQSMSESRLLEIVPEIQHASDFQSLKMLGLEREAEKVRAVLASFNGDREKTCEALGISRTTLWRKLSQK
jgi:transcriptional regulator, propionate catabolism operon regulatory protein